MTVCFIEVCDVDTFFDDFAIRVLASSNVAPPEEVEWVDVVLCRFRIDMRYQRINDSNGKKGAPPATEIGVKFLQGRLDDFVMKVSCIHPAACIFVPATAARGPGPPRGI
ncbi:hypothetical protein RFM98_20780 [Mesorhizobium sp. VK9D]|uniref:hypothetical protein n=1 Tax=Mesorhizobium australafricanum TaxID=3072311 RepID=UPI002A23E5FB|nr:hypothetical protein [Mesorhizobium sp. VK9D]MDX8455191.1 hypothetical protein [Mesorhizobium sp. VK9D]